MPVRLGQRGKIPEVNRAVVMDKQVQSGDEIRYSWVDDDGYHKWDFGVIDSVDDRISLKSGKTIDYEQIESVSTGAIQQTTQSTTSTTTMSEAQTADGSAESLNQHSYGDLMNAARSAREQFDDVNIDTNAPKKPELIEAMVEYGFEGSRQDGWTVEVDGETREVDLLNVQTPQNQSQGGTQYPTDATVLYCLTRAETTEDRVEELQNAIEDHSRFELREAAGDKYSITLPKEEQEGWVPEDEREDDEDEPEADEETESDDEDEGTEEAEESSETEEDADEADSEDEPEEEEAESEESSETDSEADEDDSDDARIPYDVARERLEDKTDDQLYDIAVDLEVEGRTSMNKDEKVDAILEHRIEEGKVAED